MSKMNTQNVDDDAIDCIYDVDDVDEELEDNLSNLNVNDKECDNQVKILSSTILELEEKLKRAEHEKESMIVDNFLTHYTLIFRYYQVIGFLFDPQNTELNKRQVAHHRLELLNVMKKFQDLRKKIEQIKGNNDIEKLREKFLTRSDFLLISCGLYDGEFENNIIIQESKRLCMCECFCDKID